MKVRTHRGAVEVEADGKRLVLDLGRPPPVPDPALLGVVISHGHPDQQALVHLPDPDVPLFMGAAAYDVLNEAAFFTGAARLPEPAGFLRDREPMSLGPFRLTPYLADHSSFDAYSLLVESDGRRVFHTGDLRDHGGESGAFKRLLDDPPTDVHILLVDGAPVPDDGQEQDLEAACAQVCRETSGMVLASYSAQNMDRLATLYRAAVRAGRDFVMDLYTASVAGATGRDTMPRIGQDNVRVYLPSSQRRRIVRDQAFERTAAIESVRIYPDELVERRGELVMTFDQSMASDLERVGCLDDARLLRWVSPGHPDDGDDGVLAFCERNNIPHSIQHVSGHVPIEDVQRLAGALDADRVMPVHDDGEWWAA